MKVGKLQEVVLELKVGDVMTKDLVTAHPRTRMSELRDLLRANRISGMPVVDDGRLRGVVSVEDFITFLADRERDCPVEERMTEEVRTIFADEPLGHALGKFERFGVGRFPVIERVSGELVGIMTKGDAIRGLLARLESEFHQEELERYGVSHFFEDVDSDAAKVTLRYAVAGQDFERAGEAASNLKRALALLGVPPGTARRVAIACYEAELNLTIFTPGGSIGVKVEPSKIRLEVRDSGPGIADVERALQPGFSTAEDWVRELGFGAGMGLPNIRNMSDEFEIRSRPGEGTALDISFDIGEGEDDAG